MEIIARSQADSNGFDVLVGYLYIAANSTSNESHILDPECCGDPRVDLVVEAFDHLGSTGCHPGSARGLRRTWLSASS